MYYSSAQVEKDVMGNLGIPEENRKFGLPCHRWEDNIRMILREREMIVWTILM